MATIFTKIINGEIPSYKVAEDDNFIAFLDINPIKRGHTLVVPKQDVDYIFDQDDEVLRDLIVFSKRVARGIDQAMDSARVGMSVIGLEVPHTHVHLIPIDTIADMDFGAPRPTISPEEMAATAKAIATAIDNESGSTEIVDGFDYKDYLALVLIYVANTSEGLSEEEKRYILNQVGEKHYEKAFDFFNNHSEFEVVNKIQSLSNGFSKSKDEVVADMKEIIKIDDADPQFEQAIVTTLSRML